MANHNKERYLQFQLSTQRQDDNYLVLGKQTKHELNIQAQVQNRKKMKLEHVMAKELILNDKEHEKLEYNKCLKVSEVEHFLLQQSQALQPLQNLFQIVNNWIEFTKNRQS